MGLVNGPQTKIWHAVASSEQADMKITGKGASNQILGGQVGKNHWFAWRTNGWPLVREIIFSDLPPINSFISDSDPWRAFWVDQALFKGPRLNLRRLRNNDSIQVWHAWGDGPRTLLRTTEAKRWLCVCWKHSYFLCSKKEAGLYPPCLPPLRSCVCKNTRIRYSTHPFVYQPHICNFLGKNYFNKRRGWKMVHSSGQPRKKKE